MANDGDSNEADRVDWLASTILEAADAAGIGVSAVVAAPELQHVFATSAVETLFGRTHEELFAMDPLGHYAGEERGRLERLTADFRARGTFPPALEATATRGDGKEVALEFGLGGVDIEGRPGVVAFIADVTERRTALESLRKSEARFRSVVEQIPEAIFMTEGTAVTYANPAFLHVLGLDEREPRRRLDVLDLVHAADRPRLREQIEKLVGGAMGRAEYRMRALDGHFRTLEIAAIAAEFDHRPTIVWLGQDVTRRKELEGRLLQADRLAVLGTLAAGMAHAINNPLSYTLLNLEHVARRMRHLTSERDYYAEARVRLAEAHDGADRVAKVVRQMRALSRPRVSEPASVDVRTVLENVLTMVGNEIRHRGQLVMRCNPIPRVFAAEGELEQALLGLLVYVARSLPDEAGQPREIRIATGSDEDGNALITVSDDGPALSEEARGRLLDPFATGEALGLGLAMCQAILASMDGHIEVQGGPSRGTRFRVVLPAATSVEGAKSQRRPVSVAPPPPSEVTPPRARVLVIDDDPGVGSTLRAMLEAHHEVRSVESAREGLRLLLSNEDFDVVFCDLVMPELSGIDLYCAVELNRPENTGRLVFMTGGVFTPDAERFLAQVPNLRIEKPFSLARVEQLLAQAVAAREEAPAPPEP